MSWQQFCWQSNELKVSACQNRERGILQTKKREAVYSAFLQMCCQMMMSVAVAVTYHTSAFAPELYSTVSAVVVGGDGTEPVY